MNSKHFSRKRSSDEEEVIKSLCNCHCGGACLLTVHIQGGVITRIETDDGEEPQLRACLRGRAQRKRVYAPDRLKFPMKRVGARGEGKFARISWDEALSTVASELKRVKETYGPESIIFRGGGGDLGLLHSRRTIDRLLAMSGGYSQTWGYISHEGGRYASLATFGTEATRSSRDDLLNSRLIVMWGFNPAHVISDTNTCWYLARAKESGVRIVCIDPRYSDTAAIFAHQWIPIWPGTDAAMLIAMAYVIIKENLQDQKFLDTYTVGFDKFKEYVLGIEDGVPKKPAWAEAITGVPSATIENLAREYATTKPAALVAGIAPGRTAYGEQYHRAAITLSAMTGNIGIHGGDSGGRAWTANAGFSDVKVGWPLSGMTVDNPVLYFGRKYAIGSNVIRDRGSVNICQIADAILKGQKGGYPFEFKLLYIMNANFLNQTPDINKTIQALKKLEFIVVQEQFMTPTAKFADILLPVSTSFERNDIGVGEGVPYYGYMAKAIEPLYECKSQLEIGTELAARMGISDYSNKTEDEWLRNFMKSSEIPDYDEFKEKGIFKLKHLEQYVAFQKQIEDTANNPFPTPSGKIEIYSQRLANFNDPKLPPIPKYIETWESRNDPSRAKYPLQLITTHPKRRQHSQMETIPWLRKLHPQVIEINPIDAQARDFCDGDEVRVFNDRGGTAVRAKITQRITPGVVNIEEGAWYEPDGIGVDRAGSANVLTSDRVSPGGAIPFNTNLVQVHKV